MFVKLTCCTILLVPGVVSNNTKLTSRRSLQHRSDLIGRKVVHQSKKAGLRTGVVSNNTKLTSRRSLKHSSELIGPKVVHQEKKEVLRNHSGIRRNLRTVNNSSVLRYKQTKHAVIVSKLFGKRASGQLYPNVNLEKSKADLILWCRNVRFNSKQFRKWKKYWCSKKLECDNISEKNVDEDSDGEQLDHSEYCDNETDLMAEIESLKGAKEPCESLDHVSYSNCLGLCQHFRNLEATVCEQCKEKTTLVCDRTKERCEPVVKCAEKVGESQIESIARGTEPTTTCAMENEFTEPALTNNEFSTHSSSATTYHKLPNSAETPRNMYGNLKEFESNDSITKSCRHKPTDKHAQGHEKGASLSGNRCTESGLKESDLLDSSKENRKLMKGSKTVSVFNGIKRHDSHMEGQTLDIERVARDKQKDKLRMHVDIGNHVILKDRNKELIEELCSDLTSSSTAPWYKDLSSRDIVYIIVLCNHHGFVKVSKEMNIPKTQLLKWKKLLKMQRMLLMKKDHDKVDKENEKFDRNNNSSKPFCSKGGPCLDRKPISERKPLTERNLNINRTEMNIPCKGFRMKVKDRSEKDSLYDPFHVNGKSENTVFHPNSKTKQLDLYDLKKSESLSWIWNNHVNLFQTAHLLVAELSMNNPSVATNDRTRVEKPEKTSPQKPEPKCLSESTRENVCGAAVEPVDHAVTEKLSESDKSPGLEKPKLMHRVKQSGPNASKLNCDNSTDERKRREPLNIDEIENYAVVDIAEVKENLKKAKRIEKSSGHASEDGILGLVDKDKKNSTGLTQDVNGFENLTRKRQSTCLEVVGDVSVETGGKVAIALSVERGNNETFAQRMSMKEDHGVTINTDTIASITIASDSDSDDILEIASWVIEPEENKAEVIVISDDDDDFDTVIIEPMKNKPLPSIVSIKTEKLDEEFDKVENGLNNSRTTDNEYDKAGVSRKGSNKLKAIADIPIKRDTNREKLKGDPQKQRNSEIIVINETGLGNKSDSQGQAIQSNSGNYTNSSTGNASTAVVCAPTGLQGQGPPSAAGSNAADLQIVSFNDLQPGQDYFLLDGSAFQPPPSLQTPGASSILKSLCESAVPAATSLLTTTASSTSSLYSSAVNVQHSANPAMIPPPSLLIGGTNEYAKPPPPYAANSYFYSSFSKQSTVSATQPPLMHLLSNTAPGKTVVSPASVRPNCSKQVVIIKTPPEQQLSSKSVSLLTPDGLKMNQRKIILTREPSRNSPGAPVTSIPTSMSARQAKETPVPVPVYPVSLVKNINTISPAGNNILLKTTILPSNISYLSQSVKRPLSVSEKLKLKKLDSKPTVTSSPTFIPLEMSGNTLLSTSSSIYPSSKLKSSKARRISFSESSSETGLEPQSNKATSMVLSGGIGAVTSAVKSAASTSSSPTVSMMLSEQCGALTSGVKSTASSSSSIPKHNITTHGRKTGLTERIEPFSKLDNSNTKKEVLDKQRAKKRKQDLTEKSEMLSTIDKSNTKEEEELDKQRAKANFLDLSAYVSEDQIDKEKTLLSALKTRKQVDIKKDEVENVFFETIIANKTDTTSPSHLSDDSQKQNQADSKAHPSKTDGNTADTASRKASSENRLYSLISSMQARMISKKEKKDSETNVTSAAPKLADDTYTENPSTTDTVKQIDTAESVSQGSYNRIESLISSITKRVSKTDSETSTNDPLVEAANELNQVNRKSELKEPMVTNSSGKTNIELGVEIDLNAPSSSSVENIQGVVAKTHQRKGQNRVRRDIRDIKKGVFKETAEEIVSTESENSNSSEASTESVSSSNRSLEVSDSEDSSTAAQVTGEDGESVNLSEKLKSLLNADIFNVISSDSDQEPTEKEEESEADSELENNADKEVDPESDNAKVDVITEIGAQAITDVSQDPNKDTNVVDLEVDLTGGAQWMGSSTNNPKPALQTHQSIQKHELEGESKLKKKYNRLLPQSLKYKFAKLATMFSAASLAEKYGLNKKTLIGWKWRYKNAYTPTLELTTEELILLEKTKEYFNNVVAKKEYQIYVDNPEEDESRDCKIITPTAKAPVPKQTKEQTDESRLSKSRNLLSNVDCKIITPTAIAPVTTQTKEHTDESRLSKSRNLLSNLLKSKVVDAENQSAKPSIDLNQATLDIKAAQSSSNELFYIPVDYRKNDALTQQLRQSLKSLKTPGNIAAFKMSNKEATASIFGEVSVSKETTPVSKACMSTEKNLGEEECVSKHISVSVKPDETVQSKAITEECARKLISVPVKPFETAKSKAREEKGVDKFKPHSEKPDETDDAHTKASWVSEGNPSDNYSRSFKTKVVKEARESGFEKTSKWFNLPLTELMKWHDEFLNGTLSAGPDRKESKNIVTDLVKHRVQEEMPPLDGKANADVEKRAKINAGLSFERIQKKEGAITKPRFNTLHPTTDVTATSKKQNKTRMGPNTPVNRRSIEQLQLFKADVRGDLGIMPKLIKPATSTSSNIDDVEIASTWKQVQSIIAPKRPVEKKYTLEFRNKIIKECGTKGQKSVSEYYRIPYNELSRWRLEARKLLMSSFKPNPAPKKPIEAPKVVFESVSTAGALRTSKSASELHGGIVQSSEPPFTRATITQGLENDSLKIRLKILKPGEVGTDKPSTSRMSETTKKVEVLPKQVSKVSFKSAQKASARSEQKSPSRSEPKPKTSRLPEQIQPRPSTSKTALKPFDAPPTSVLDEDTDLRMQIINYCFEQGVLKTQKKFNVTRQSIIDLMNEYDNLNKYSVDTYNREHGFQNLTTKLVSREKTSVEVTNTIQPVIVKNLTDYIVTEEYKASVVEYSKNHGITAASRKFKRKLGTVRTWINEFQREEKKKIAEQQIVKEIELLRSNMSVEEARKISYFEARKKRLQLENEFRNQYKKAVVEFAKTYSITEATKKYKKKTQTIKCWMGHFAKAERDAKKFDSSEEGCDETNADQSALEHTSSSGHQLVPYEISDASPPTSPIWEQDFVIKPSSGKSPLKMTFSPRRRSSPVISKDPEDDDCYEIVDGLDDEDDSEVNDIETEDEEEGNKFVELSAREIHDLKENAQVQGPSKKVPMVVITDELGDVAIRRDITADKANASAHMVHDKEIDPEITKTKSSDTEALISPTDVPNIFESGDFSFDMENDMVDSTNEDNRVEQPKDTSVIEPTIAETNNVDETMKADLTPNELEDEMEDEHIIENIPYENTVMFKVLTSEMEDFFKDASLSLAKEAPPKKSLGADAEIIANIEETYLFTQNRATRNSFQKEKAQEAQDAQLAEKKAEEAQNDSKSKEKDVNVATDIANEAKTEPKGEESPQTKNHENVPEVLKDNKQEENHDHQESVSVSDTTEKKSDESVFDTTKKKSNESVFDTTKQKSDEVETVVDSEANKAVSESGEVVTSAKKDTNIEKEMPPTSTSLDSTLSNEKLMTKQNVEEKTTTEAATTTAEEKKERSLFDFLIIGDEIPKTDANTKDIAELNTTSVGKSKKGFSLFGNLMKNLSLPTLATKMENTSKTTEATAAKNVTEETEDRTVSEDAESKNVDKSERNLFDLIGIKQEPSSPTEQPSSQPKSLFKAITPSPEPPIRKLRSNSKTPPGKSSTPIVPQKKAIFKFPKLALSVNFGNIAKLGMAKLKEDSQAKPDSTKDDIESGTSVNEMDEKAEEKEIDTVQEIPDNKVIEGDGNSKNNLEDKAVDTSDEKDTSSVSPSPGVVMETFEQLRQRLAHERALAKAKKEKEKIESEKKDEIDGTSEGIVESDVEKVTVVKAKERVDDDEDEMYKDFAPQKIVLILDISKKHGIDFASSSFDLPVSVIVNWIIEKDRKHRKVSLVVSLEGKLLALQDLKSGKKGVSELADEHEVGEEIVRKWEAEVGWILDKDGVMDVLSKWNKVESVANLNIEEVERMVQRHESMSSKTDDTSEYTELSDETKHTNANKDTDDIKDTKGMNEMEKELNLKGVEVDKCEAVEFQKVNETPAARDESEIRPDQIVEEESKLSPIAGQTTDNSSNADTADDGKSPGNTTDKDIAEERKVEKDMAKVREVEDEKDIAKMGKSEDGQDTATEGKLDNEKDRDEKDISKVGNVDNGQKIEEKAEETKPMMTMPDILNFITDTQAREYSLEQKAMLVVLANKFGKKEVCYKLGINQSTLGRWSRKKTVISEFLDEQTAGFRKVKKMDEFSSVSPTEIQKSVPRSKASKLSKESSYGSSSYRMISPTKLPAVLRSLKKAIGSTKREFSVEQKVAIVKLVELYGVRQVHKQFRIALGTIWNWQHSKAIKQAIANEEAEIANKDNPAKKLLEFDPEEKDHANVSVDAVLDRVLVISETGKDHVNFTLDQKADVVFLVQHFGLDYVCEKLPQIPSGILWHWRHSRHILPLVNQMEKKAKEQLVKADASRTVEGTVDTVATVTRDTVDKTGLTQQWLKECQATVRNRKRAAATERDASVESLKRRKMDGSEADALRVDSEDTDRVARESSPSSICSDVSIHSDEFEEIESDSEMNSPSVNSKKSGASTLTTKSGSVKAGRKQTTNQKQAKTSPGTTNEKLDGVSVTSAKTDRKKEKKHEPDYEVKKIEWGADMRMMVLYTVNNGEL